MGRNFVGLIIENLTPQKISTHTVVQHNSHCSSPYIYIYIYISNLICNISSLILHIMYITCTCTSCIAAFGNKSTESAEPSPSVLITISKLS